MEFGEIALDAALGGILAHSERVPGGRLRKGVRLGEGEIAALRAAGVARVTVASPGPYDVGEDDAALALARALVPEGSAGLMLRAMGTGRVNVIATTPGIVRVDAGRVNRINAADPMLTLATVAPWARMAPGGMVATVKVIAYAVNGASLAAACDAARGAGGGVAAGEGAAGEDTVGPEAPRGGAAVGNAAGEDAAAMKAGQDADAMGLATRGDAGRGLAIGSVAGEPDTFRRWESERPAGEGAAGEGAADRWPADDGSAGRREGDEGTADGRRVVGPVADGRAAGKPTRGRAALSLLPAVRRRVVLIQTHASPGEDGAKGRRVTAMRVERLGGTLGEVTDVPHQVEPLAAALGDVRGADLILILTASATSDWHDTAPEAVRRAGGVVEHFGMPVDPGNLLFLGRIGRVPVIGLPGCARSPALNGADWVLERIMCGQPVTARTIAAMGVGGLLKEIASRPQPREGG